MQFRFEEIPAPQNNPFINCKLARSQFAEFLTQVIEKNDDGFVLSLNNRWGDGKTTFLRMWSQQLKDKGFTVVNFNAWENDFEDNPLISFIAEIKKEIGGSRINFDKTIKAAAIVFKEIIPIAAKHLAEKHLGKDSVEMATATTKGSTSLFEDSIKNYDKKKNARQDFKNNLGKWIADSVKKPQVVFIIDELDRCRPNYSVQLLEQIKHFFNVPNIVFVLAIDKVQLGHAVRGVYGSDLINADEYLRRFIDIEYSLPKVPSAYFVEHLIEKFGLKPWLQKKAFDESSSLTFKEIIFLFDQHDISIRAQEKIICHLSVIAETYGERKFHGKVFSFLLFIKHYNQDLFENIKHKTISLEQLEISLEKIYETKKGFLTVTDIFIIKAHILVFYFNYADRIIKPDKVFYKASKDGYTLKSKNPQLDVYLKNISFEYKDENMASVLSLVDMMIVQ